MDPLTHVVVGRAIVAVGDSGDRAPRGVAWSAALAALSPDIDSVVAFGGWDRYVRIHEFATHSILGAIALAALTAVVVSSVARLRDVVTVLRGRGSTRPAVAPFAGLFAAAAAGALSHLILDMLCGGRLRPGWPIVDSRVTVPIVAMADPWFVAICLAGLVARWPGRLHWRATSRAMLTATVLLVAVKAAFLARAARTPPAAMSMLAIEPHWGSLTEWSLFERTPEAVRVWTIDGRGGSPSPSITHRLAADTPLSRASLALDTVRNFLSVHEFTFVVERLEPSGGVEELWTDLRYCWATRPDDAQVVRAGDQTSCAVWAGGAFDTAGRVTMQLVKIGQLVQQRPPP